MLLTVSLTELVFSCCLSHNTIFRLYQDSHLASLTRLLLHACGLSLQPFLLASPTPNLLPEPSLLSRVLPDQHLKRGDFPVNKDGRRMRAYFHSRSNRTEWLVALIRVGPVHEKRMALVT